MESPGLTSPTDVTNVIPRKRASIKWQHCHLKPSIMLRSQALRVAKFSPPAVASISRAPVAKRRYATLENPGPDVKKPKNNTLLITVLVAAAAAGGYWYYSESDNLQAEAKAHEEEAKKKAREATEAGKARLEDAYKQGQAKYGDMKASVDKSIQDAEARTKQAAENAQAKLNDYKNDARDSVENLYNDARASTVKKEEQAKEGWFSWLGWGKSKTEDAKKSSAEKVSDAAADVKSKADKHT
ncbi:hypothetical protein VKT23_001086 [Stygiomarasmius scandens]|uniref:Late embryogenesis abundant protein n=1 Tax=Marasmiellus scandens TaxID=2682957 RepID=A0ABR1K9V7_9AGAR